MTDPIAEGSDTYQMKDYKHMQDESKIDKMSKLRREVEFLEREMQRVRTKLKRLQKDPTNIFHAYSRTKTKQSIGQHDYYETEQSNVQVTHDNYMYIDIYSTVKQQIRAVSYYLGKFMKKHKNNMRMIKQIEHKRPNDYYFDSIRRQPIPNKIKVVSKDRKDSQEYFGVP